MTPSNRDQPHCPRSRRSLDARGLAGSGADYLRKQDEHYQEPGAAQGCKAQLNDARDSRGQQRKDHSTESPEAAYRLVTDPDVVCVAGPGHKSRAVYTSIAASLRRKALWRHT